MAVMYIIPLKLSAYLPWNEIIRNTKSRKWDDKNTKLRDEKAMVRSQKRVSTMVKTRKYDGVNAKLRWCKREITMMKMRNYGDENAKLRWWKRERTIVKWRNYADENANNRWWNQNYDVKNTKLRWWKREPTMITQNYNYVCKSLPPLLFLIRSLAFITLFPNFSI